jgi:hypothetical protein
MRSEACDRLLVDRLRPFTAGLRALKRAAKIRKVWKGQREEGEEKGDVESSKRRQCKFGYAVFG